MQQQCWKRFTNEAVHGHVRHGAPKDRHNAPEQTSQNITSFFSTTLAPLIPKQCLVYYEYIIAHHEVAVNSPQQPICDSRRTSSSPTTTSIDCTR